MCKDNNYFRNHQILSVFYYESLCLFLFAVLTRVCCIDKQTSVTNKNPVAKCSLVNCIFKYLCAL